MKFFDDRYEDYFLPRPHVTEVMETHGFLYYCPIVGQTRRVPLTHVKSRTDTYFAQTAQMLNLPPEWMDAWDVAHYDEIAQSQQFAKYAKVVQRHAPNDEHWATAKYMLQEQDKAYWYNVGLRNGFQVVLDMDWSKSPSGMFTYLCTNTFDFLDRHIFDLDRYFQQYPSLVTTAVTMSLKEEIRLKEKLDAHKVRLFFGTNKAQYYVWSIYFGEQNEAFVNHRSVGNHHTIGLSKYGNNWDSFIRNFHFPNNFDFDVSGCDMGIQAFEQEQDLNDRMKYYPHCVVNDPVHRKRMVSAYWANVFACVILTNGLVVKLEHSNLSGRTDTTIVGSRTNIRRTFYCFSWLTGLTGPECLREMWRHVRFVWNNDDALFSVSNKYIGVFNCVTIATWWKQHLNVELESGAPYPRTIESCIFLGNYSKLFMGRWVPQPLTTKVFGSLKKGAKSNSIVVSLTRAAQILLDQYFNDDVRDVLTFHIQRLQEIARRTGVAETDDWKIALTQVKSQDQILDLYLTPRTEEELSEVIDLTYF